MLNGIVKVKQISEREYVIGVNRIYLNEDNIVCVSNLGEENEKSAIAMKEAYFKLANIVEGKTNVLIDLTNAGKSSPEARNIWKELTENEKTGKIALFGLHPVARVLATFVITISKNKSMCFFNTKEEALSWLKEE
ncbi:MAG: hypothetical protein A3J83_05110 [Elusimicrobia bacterium RIFOXYA2_FULL_40_6]|nr:MAG: hypothetical protein A3J83_05110 [Elusimicrobia bacterium RIFOXYA2_FULL_40_6]